MSALDSIRMNIFSEEETEQYCKGLQQGLNTILSVDRYLSFPQIEEYYGIAKETVLAWSKIDINDCDNGYRRYLLEFARRHNPKNTFDLMKEHRLPADNSKEFISEVLLMDIDVVDSMENSKVSWRSRIIRHLLKLNKTLFEKQIQIIKQMILHEDGIRKFAVVKNISLPRYNDFERGFNHGLQIVLTIDKNLSFSEIEEYYGIAKETVLAWSKIDISDSDKGHRRLFLEFLKRYHPDNTANLMQLLQAPINNSASFIADAFEAPLDVIESMLQSKIKWRSAFVKNLLSINSQLLEKQIYAIRQIALLEKEYEE